MCKLKVYMITHTKEKPSTTNWYFWKISEAIKVKRVSCIKTHSKEKPSKISTITFAILPFYQKKKTLTLNVDQEYSEISLSWWKHQMHLKMVHSHPKITKSRACQSQVCYLHTTYLGPRQGIMPVQYSITTSGTCDFQMCCRC